MRGSDGINTQNNGNLKDVSSFLFKAGHANLLIDIGLNIILASSFNMLKKLICMADTYGKIKLSRF